MRTRHEDLARQHTCLLTIGLSTGISIDSDALTTDTLSRAERNAKAAVSKVLAGLEGALRSEAPAEKIVGMLYAENVIVTEEPPALNLRDMKQNVEGAHGFLDYLGSNGGKGWRPSKPASSECPDPTRIDDLVQ